ncbi:MAG TPA: TRAP transporter small permease [Desulfobacterales bacterium]|jgi:C4-dicarboxylate transporter DctQ subunit|nr:TRAP transporter small permease [Desulfobacterales bacterium]
MNRAGRFFFDKVYFLSNILAGCAFTALCISVGVQVVSRYLFNVSFGWAEEFPLFVFLWVCFIAAAAAYRQDSHLGVSLVFDRLPRRFRKVARYIELFLTLAFFFVIFYYESDVALSLSSSFVVLKFPKIYYFIGIPVGALIFMVFVIEKIIDQFQADFGKGRYVKKENDPAKA